MSEESITPLSTTGINFKVEINYVYLRGRIDFKRISLKRYYVSFFYSWKCSKFLYF